jgi:hypothetical protein
VQGTLPGNGSVWNRISDPVRSAGPSLQQWRSCQSVQSTLVERQPPTPKHLVIRSGAFCREGPVHALAPRSLPADYIGPSRCSG